MKQRLIIVGPLPPPYHGVTVSTSLVLANPLLRERFKVEHLDTSDRRGTSNLGRWDVTNVALALHSLGRLLRMLRGEPGLVYLPISQNAPAFLRDSLFVHAAARRRWRVVGHLRGSDFLGFYARTPRTFRSWIRITLRQFASVAVMGESLRGVFDGLVEPERITVVSNGTPAPALDGVEREPNNVLFLSNLRRRKGIMESVEAARLVAREDQRARFVFVGDWEDGKLERELRARTTEVSSQVQFHPSVTGPEKDRLLASSSILLFPPREPEGHPRVVLEGLAAGLPIVTTNRGAIAETVIDGECGFVLEEPVPEEIAQRLLELLQDDAARERMSKAARERYLASFTQDAADRRLAEWLSEVAES